MTPKPKLFLSKLKNICFKKAEKYIKRIYYARGKKLTGVFYAKTAYKLFIGKKRRGRINFFFKSFYAKNAFIFLFKFKKK